MASESPDPHQPYTARTWLDAMAGDRQKLAGRAKAPAWYYPSLGLVAAALVAVPGIGSVTWSLVLVAGAGAALVFLESGYQKKTGLSTYRPAGPRSLLVLIGMGVVVLAMLVLSAVLSAAGLRPWVLVPALVVLLTMFPGGLLYDRVYGTDLRRGI